MTTRRNDTVDLALRSYGALRPGVVSRTCF